MRPRVLVVGQTPPPHHGQAAMIERLVNAGLERVALSHVRMAFSASFEEIGRPRPAKLLHLAWLILAIARARIERRAEVLLYPPAGPSRTPLYRDLVLLLATRWMFRHVVFQFHAGGLSELVARLPAPLRALCRLAYGRADLALLLSELNPRDGEYFGARRSQVVPYGIEDVAGPRGDALRERPRPPRILYVGALRESKGCLVLLDACELLAARGVAFELRLVGEPESEAFARRLAAALARPALEGRVRTLGLRTAEAKWAEYEAASIFCFPTFYEAESFGLVLLEAMQFGLPVVATRWRGVASVVEDGESGRLVPPRDAPALAAALGELLADATLAARLGARGRERYLERFTLERYLRELEDALLSVTRQAA